PPFAPCYQDQFLEWVQSGRGLYVRQGGSHLLSPSVATRATDGRSIRYRPLTAVERSLRRVERRPYPARSAAVRHDGHVPEGDTVWNTAQALHRALVGDELLSSDFRVPRLATVDLTGALVVDSGCRGKHLLLRLAGPGDERRLTLHSHLRMDGAWLTLPPAA